MKIKKEIMEVVMRNEEMNNEEEKIEVIAENREELIDEISTVNLFYVSLIF